MIEGEGRYLISFDQCKQDEQNMQVVANYYL